MKYLLKPVTLCSCCYFASAGTALAHDVHRAAGMQGQPSQTCGTTMTGGMTPGKAAMSPGSPFNPIGNAGFHYAGNQPQNSKNPKSKAQYDVACFQQSHK